MNKNILNLKYTIHVLCLMSLVSVGIFGFSLNMYLNTSKKASSDNTDDSISLVKNENQDLQNENNINSSADKCEKFKIGDIFPDKSTMDKQFVQYVNTLPEKQKNIYLKVKDKFKDSLFIMDKFSFDNSKPAVDFVDTILTADEIESMKGYYKGSMIPFLGFAYIGDTLISKYFEALFVAEKNGDNQITKYDKSLEGYNTLTAFTLLFVIIGASDKPVETTLSEMNEQLSILNYTIGISKSNAKLLTEKEVHLYSLCKAKQEILGLNAGKKDPYSTGNPYLNKYKEETIPKIDFLINSYSNGSYEQFDKIYYEMVLEVSKIEPRFKDKSDEEILATFKASLKSGYDSIKYLSELDPESVYSN